MKLRSLFAAMFLVASCNATAEGFYIGAHIGSSGVDDVADASRTVFSGTAGLPDRLSIDGLLLDSSESSAGVFFGWQAYDWLALELEYIDFGEAEQPVPFGFNALPPLPVPIDPLPPGLGIIPVIPPIPSNLSLPLRLGVEQWSISAKFRKALVSELSAVWFVGVSHAEFDARGEIIVNEVVSFDPLELQPVTIPFESPDSELGFNFGFGLAWDFNDRFGTELGYRQHRLEVADVETVSLRFLLTL